MVRDYMKQLQSHQYPEIGRADGPHPRGGLAPPRDHQAPRPQAGQRYSPERSTYILPDVFVVKEGDEYKIVLNDDGLPKLRISPTYKRMLDDKEPGSEETRAYVKDKLRSALWLLKSVDQRQRTIYKVADSIVRHQRAFLDHGVTHLRPLVLRDVASDIGMHESTVSRVVANKYMHTPRGVYEMRFFFHSGITSTMGEAVSSVTIKDRIRKMIEERGRRRIRSRTRASPSSSGRTACPWPAAPWPSTGKSCASLLRTCASPSTDVRAPARPGGADEDRVHGAADRGPGGPRASPSASSRSWAACCPASPAPTSSSPPTSTARWPRSTCTRPISTWPRARRRPTPRLPSPPRSTS